jgi:methylthioribose-1-phosphate isomerase
MCNPSCQPIEELTNSIHIEHRPAVEATMVRGRNIETGNLDTVRITPEGVGSGSEVWQGVYNPSFDVTPAELISESTFWRRLWL